MGRGVGRRAATSLWCLACPSCILERRLSWRNSMPAAMHTNGWTAERGAWGDGWGVDGACAAPQRGSRPGWLLLCIGTRRMVERVAMHHPACSRRALFCGPWAPRSFRATRTRARDSDRASRAHSRVTMGGLQWGLACCPAAGCSCGYAHLPRARGRLVARSGWQVPSRRRRERRHPSRPTRLVAVRRLEAPLRPLYCSLPRRTTRQPPWQGWDPGEPASHAPCCWPLLP